MRTGLRRIPILEAALFLGGLVFLIPIYVALVSAFKSYAEISKDPLSLPTRFDLQNIVDVFRYTNLLSAIWKSALMSVAVVGAVLVFAPMAAHRLVRTWKSAGRLTYAFFTAGMAVPFMVYMIPLLRELRAFGLSQTHLALLLTYLGNDVPFAVFLYCGFIKSVPVELEEAGEIDGAGPLGRFWRIVFPLLKPCHITAIVLFLLFTWNDFAIAYMVMGITKANLVFTEVYKLMAGTWGTQWNIILTAVVLASLPITIAYFFLQKQFISGLTTGAVKG